MDVHFPEGVQMTTLRCHFCDSEALADTRKVSIACPASAEQYVCPRCGHVFLTRIAAEDLPEENWYKNKQNRGIISITIRSQFERQGQKPFASPLSLDDLRRIVRQYKPLHPLEKLDNALMNLDRTSKYIGYGFSVQAEMDFPYYHCSEPVELSHILDFLLKENCIYNKNQAPHLPFYITQKGYERIRELKVRRPDSRQCFVAMWFTPDMDEVYDQAIRPAIEHVEKGENESKFKALNIGKKEHTNDINDEIIAEIRRSRFMVCDLTGYRGGVYWEAGFAYGLGLEVIYTCREDWVKRIALGKMQKPDGTESEIFQEGIHFDLEHRNRIEWSMGDLPGFRKRLEQRIRAVVV